MKVREKVSRPLPSGVSAALVAAAGIAAVIVFIVQADPRWTEWTPMAIAVASLFAVAVVGFVLVGLGKSGREVTSARTDKSIVEGYAHWRRRLRPYGLAVAGGFLLYAAYVAWSMFGHA